ncbi:MAG: hypothetical protein KR126chlam1_00096 [Chlamydiae bacterium]|nr:hypothetical protein [Chlamydiota bacterium]
MTTRVSFSYHSIPPPTDGNCSICQYKDNENGNWVMHNTDCQPVHVICIKRWLQDNSTCPNCRTLVNASSLLTLKEKTIIWFMNRPLLSRITTAAFAGNSLGWFLGTQASQIILSVANITNHWCIRQLENLLPEVSIHLIGEINARHMFSVMNVCAHCGLWIISSPMIYRSLNTRKPLQSCFTTGLENGIAVGVIRQFCDPKVTMPIFPGYSINLKLALDLAAICGFLFATVFGYLSLGPEERTLLR